MRGTLRRTLSLDLSLAADLSKISPALLSSGRSAAQDLQQLRAMRVTHVVNLTSNTALNAYPEEFTYLTLELDDSVTADISPLLAPSFACITVSRLFDFTE